MRVGGAKDTDPHIVKIPYITFESTVSLPICVFNQWLITNNILGLRLGIHGSDCDNTVFDPWLIKSAAVKQRDMKCQRANCVY